ncbi:DoxX family protein [Planctomonas sp. JC2975]|uniref:DoxX family protein n=1 Tax=Planctomonas sp. JC2975 TaxID=2729626 RepID=UPI001473CD2D|nr:DoxX family protein [Planctomonas sp. JC2975]NNC13486.1 DoxX family protein [Planctomonas sp. JC2975]
MTIALWIVNIILAIAYLAAGGTKLLQPKAKLAPMMGWVEDFATPYVKLIAAAEVVGALGLVLPLLTSIAPILAPIAAVCLAIIMAGAVVVHLRRKEPVLPALVLGIVSIVSAGLGFAVV